MVLNIIIYHTLCILYSINNIYLIINLIQTNIKIILTQLNHYRICIRCILDVN